MAFFLFPFIVIRIFPIPAFLVFGMISHTVGVEVIME